MKKLALVSLTLLLAGCAPTALTVAQLIINGVSLAITQKTVSDNAISLAMEQDCVMWRVLRNEYPCRDLAPDVPEGTMVASAEPTEVSDASQALEEVLSLADIDQGGAVWDIVTASGQPAESDDLIDTSEDEISLAPDGYMDEISSVSEIADEIIDVAETDTVLDPTKSVAVLDPNKSVEEAGSSDWDKFVEFFRSGKAAKISNTALKIGAKQCTGDDCTALETVEPKGLVNKIVAFLLMK